MKQLSTLRIGRLVFITFLASLAAEDVFAQQPDVKDWIFHGYGPINQLKTKVPLTLKNVTTGKAVKYGERDYGINLIWDSSGKSLQNISLGVISGSSDSIKDGEPVKFTGSSGKSVSFRINGGCRVVVSTLRLGTWRIQAWHLLNAKSSSTPELIRFS